MRRESYFYNIISQKGDPKIYGETAYSSRVKDLLILYENLSSMEKLEFQEALRTLLKSGNQVLIEIALAVCTGFMDAGLKKEQQYRTLQKRIING